MKKFRYFTFAVVLAVFACGKDKDPAPSIGDILGEKPWKLTASTITPPMFFEEVQASISDYYQALPECRRDDIWVFNSGGTYIKEEGATVCSSGDFEVIDVGSWVVNTKEELLITTSGLYYPEVYEIIELKSGTLDLVQYLSDTLGTEYAWTFSYRHSN